MALVNNNGDVTFGGLINLVQNIEDATAMSLPQYVKRAIINSRVFIQKELAGEDVLTPLLLNISNIYGGFILTAYGMNQYVTNSHTVRRLMDITATENFSEKADDDVVNIDVDQIIGNYFGSLAPKSVEVPQMVEWKATNDISTVGNKTGSSFIEIPKSVNIPQGRIIEVKFGDPKSGKGFSIPLYLQLTPKFIPSEVMEQFVAINFTPSFRQRWMQTTVGEIDFINDLIFSADLVKKRRMALKRDTDGILKSMLDRQSNSLANAWLKLSQVTPERQNIANSIMIVDEQKFKRYCNNVGMKFENYSSRQKFFNRTFTMILCSVNPMDNTVTMYFHGLDAVGSYTFRQLETNSRTESYDLSQIMRAYSQGIAPKL